MTAEIFVDTSAWYPLADPRHPDHHRLATLLEEHVLEGTRVVTTNLVVAETHALLLRRTGRSPALRFLCEIRREPLRVENSTADIEAEAVDQWLDRFVDQEFSLTDAVSFTVMARRGIEEALTLDHHFAVAGFNIPQ